VPLQRRRQTAVQLTSSPEQTRSLGRQLALRLQPGDLLSLRGHLGAGKTTLIQGIAAGLGVTDLVSSPSFTLIHQHPGRIPLYHIDLYRLSAADVGAIGLDEIVDSEAVVAVEWAEKLPADLLRNALDIEIVFDESDEDARRIHLRARGPRSARLLSSLTENCDADTRP